MSLRVRAKLPPGKYGLFGDVRRRNGDKFTLEHKGQFSHKWMEAIKWDPGKAPDRKSLPNAVGILRRKCELLEGEKAALAEKNADLVETNKELRAANKGGGAPAKKLKGLLADAQEELKIANESNAALLAQVEELEASAKAAAKDKKGDEDKKPKK